MLHLALVQNLLSAIGAAPHLTRPNFPQPAEAAWDAALFATGLRARLADAAPPALLEATAALQHLACQLAPAGQRASRIAELAGVQAGLPAGIMVAENGPYLATNVPVLRSYLGEQLAAPPQLALCRCGMSAMKPFCDGTHARSGFSGEKDPNRVPDRRDSYPGQQVTIFDNRGICQHSGLCTDRLPNKPFCSGMHWYAGFRDPALSGEPALFQWAGGLPALTRMTRLLYEKLVPADDLLAPAFADMPPGHPRREAMWLAEVFGGPAWYSRGSGDAAGPRRAHASRGFTDQQRARWAELAMRCSVPATGNL